MRLTQLLDSLQSRVSLETNFLYLERYVNDTKGDFINFSDVDPRYSPECGVVGFDAPFVRVKHDMLTIFQDQPSSEVFEAIFEDDTALFCVASRHPISIQGGGWSHNGIANIFNTHVIDSETPS